MNRVDAYRMVRRRTADAGFRVKLGCHVFRATGITAYLEAGSDDWRPLDNDIRPARLLGRKTIRIAQGFARFQSPRGRPGRG